MYDINWELIKNAFVEHGRKEKHRIDVQRWREALNKSADLSGIDSSTFQNDAAVVKNIVNIVLKKLAKPYAILKGLVGIEDKIKTLESWISKEANDKRLIGIWGMGDIGKTTLAEEVFKKLQCEYEGCYFLANKSEESKKHGISSLKNKVFSGILGEDVEICTPNSLPDDIARKIGCMKVLIVLDGMNDIDHLEKLLGTLDNFGSGSRIIVTTRDEQVLKANNVDKTYHLTEFNNNKALELSSCLQEMAWEIVCQESTIPGSRSQLSDSNDIDEVLKNGKSTEVIRSMQMDVRKIKKQKLSPHIFAEMSRLHFLKISGEYSQYTYDLKDQLDILAKGLQFLATELRFLHWDDYPLKSLPENFSTEKLVILNLTGSRLEKLWWDGVKNLVKLKQVKLCYSRELEKLPDLSKAINLEVLDLQYCSMLTGVHPSIFSLPKLEQLILTRCASLTILASDSHLCNLSYLDLSFCENLREFSVISENMKVLKLGFTKIKALPSLFEHQNKLKSLDLKCSTIERLPSSINNLTQLLHLDVSSCGQLQTIPELPMSLKTLDAYSCTSLQTLP